MGYMMNDTARLEAIKQREVGKLIQRGLHKEAKELAKEYGIGEYWYNRIDEQYNIKRGTWGFIGGR